MLSGGAIPTVKRVESIHPPPLVPLSLYMPGPTEMEVCTIAPEKEAEVQV